MGSGAKMNWKALSDVKNENMGHGEKVQYILTYSTYTFVPTYEASHCRAGGQ